MFNFNCPSCGIEMEIDECYCGKVVTCCSCRKEIVVPGIKPPVIQLGSAKSAVGENKFTNGAYSYTCPLCGTMKSSNVPLKKFSTYVILTWLLGVFGAGDFYIGNKNKGLIKLGISIICCLAGGLIATAIWSMIDLCKTRHDVDGNPLI